jgi:hypothetical protein
MPRPLAYFALPLLLLGPGCTTSDPLDSGSNLPPTGAVLVRVEVLDFFSQPVAGAQITFLSYPASGGCTSAATVTPLGGGSTDTSGTLVQLLESVPIGFAGTCLSVVTQPPSGSGLLGANKQILVFPAASTPTDTIDVRVYLL